MYKYWGFGLHIASEIQFPELLPSDFADADITIHIGATPALLEGESQVNRANSTINKNEYLMNVRNICKYYAGYGNKIIAEPAPGIDEHSVRLFLLGTVMAAILYQRGCIPLHASAIVKDGRLILFTGNSGAGKSTLLAQLATKGCPIFTDDICVIKYEASGSKVIVGAASYPMLKLWDDAIVQLDHELFTRDFKIRPASSKYGQFFYEEFNLSSLPIDKIFILNPLHNTDEIIIKKLGSIPAFKKLEKQTYKYRLITHTKLRALHFSILSQLISEVSVYEVNRPVTGTNIELLFDAIENLL